MSKATKLSSEQWAAIKDRIPGAEGSIGRNPINNRATIEAMVHKLTKGCAWEKLPAVYGKPGTIHRRFERWRTSGAWTEVEALLQEVGALPSSKRKAA